MRLPLPGMVWCGLLCGFLILGCKGGAAAPAPDPVPDPDPPPDMPLVPPTVQRVGFAGSNTGAGHAVLFIAELSGEATTFAWDFGEGATPSTSTETTPRVTLAAPGNYAGTLAVGNAAGTTQAFAFSYVVGVTRPELTAVEASVESGVPEQPVQFLAEAVGYPQDWSWDFGGGATPNVTSAPIPIVDLLAPGTFQGSVIASNGAGESERVPFTYTVQPSPWHSTDFPGIKFRSAHRQSTIVVEGRRWLASLEARVLNPQITSDWIAHGALSGVGGPAMVVHRGRPAAVSAHNQALRVLRYNEIGTDLTEVPYPPYGEIGEFRVAAAGHRLVVTCLVAPETDPTLTQAWVMAAPPSGQLTDPAPWTPFALTATPPMSGAPSVATNAGWLAVAVRGPLPAGGLQLWQVVESDLDDPGAWQHTTIDSDSEAGVAADLLPLADGWAAAYYLGTTGEGALRFARTTTLAPAGPDQWRLMEVSPEGQFTTGIASPFLIEHAGGFAIAQMDTANRDMWLTWTGTTTPQSAEDWQREVMEYGTVMALVALISEGETLQCYYSVIRQDDTWALRRASRVLPGLEDS